MRKHVLLFLILLPAAAFSQTKASAYLELRGSIDIMGNINLGEVVKPRRLETKADSLVDYNVVGKIFSKTTDPINVLNALSAEGWNLVSVTQILTDKDGKPNTPFLLYYLRHEY